MQSPPPATNMNTGQGRRPPGMTDVARLAGVSQKTVSRVINGERYVSDHIRERVQRAARQLGYRRNTAARALSTGRFQRIGVVALGSALYGPTSLVIALERAMRSAGFSFTMANTLEGQRHGIANAVDWLLEQGVDGIALSVPIDEGEQLRVDPGVPVLSFARLPGLTGSRVAFVGADGVAAGRTATQHLLDLGHTTVWHVAGPNQWWAARDRRDGWQRALDAAGAPVPPIVEGDWSPASGFDAGTRLARDPDVTAVFVANDEMAIGLMRALHDAGRVVPDDVSVIGFDDIPSAPYLSPPLTTIRQDFDAVAVQSLDLLIRQIDRTAGGSGDLPEEQVHDDLPTELVLRKSTAAPAHSRRTDAPHRKEVQ